MAVLSIAFYFVRSAVAGDMLNGRLDGAISIGENAVTPLVVQTTMIVSLIGLASGFSGVLHFKEWNNTMRLVGTGVGMIACNLDLLCFGYSCKMLSVGCIGVCTAGGLSGKALFIAAGAIIQVFIQITYVIVIYLTPLDEPSFIEEAAEDCAAPCEPTSQSSVIANRECC